MAPVLLATVSILMNAAYIAKSISIQHFMDPIGKGYHVADTSQFHLLPCLIIAIQLRKNG
jgi:hypothetical protein